MNTVERGQYETLDFDLAQNTKISEELQNCEETLEEVAEMKMNTDFNAINNNNHKIDKINNNNNSNTNSEHQQVQQSVEMFECSLIASSDNDLSFSMAVDREVEAINRSIDSDELPAFEIRLLSPTGCTPSPIDFDDEEGEEYIFRQARSCHSRHHNVSPHSTSTSSSSSSLSPPCIDHSEFVTLRDIDAQISPPSEYGTPMSNNVSLETIYEDVFLNTPPRPHSRLRRQSLLNNSGRSPRNLLEKITVHRLLQSGKMTD